MKRGFRVDDFAWSASKPLPRANARSRSCRLRISQPDRECLSARVSMRTTGRRALSLLGLGSSTRNLPQFARKLPARHTLGTRNPYIRVVSGANRQRNPYTRTPGLDFIQRGVEGAIRDISKKNEKMARFPPDYVLVFSAQPEHVGRSERGRTNFATNSWLGTDPAYSSRAHTRRVSSTRAVMKHIWKGF